MPTAWQWQDLFDWLSAWRWQRQVKNKKKYQLKYYFDRLKNYFDKLKNDINR